MTSTSPALPRRLTLADAVVIGLGSMIGAGIFSAFAPAAAAAGAGLLLGLAIAALVASANALSSAQLAAQYPTSGGTYVYGRERLGHWAGFTAGWGFVVGKTASCAAMALTVAAYVAPGSVWAQKAIGLVAVIALAALNYRGITRTARAARVLVALSLLALATVVVAVWTGGEADPNRILGNPGAAGATGASGANGIPGEPGSPGGAGDADGGTDPIGSAWYGVLQAAGLLFFAFAGYARIATLGEEVAAPRRTIPRAIVIALVLAVAVYALVAVSALAAAGADGLAATSSPLRAAVEAAGAAWASPIVRAGGAVAALGALLSLIAGIGRTSLAMARNRDLPTWFAAVHPIHAVPYRAEVVLAVVVCAVVLATDLRGAIGFSSFGVLVYYALANTSALTQDAGHRLVPRAVSVLGLVGCVVLVVTLPIASVVAGLAVFVLGLGGRALVLMRRGDEPR